MNHEEGKNNEQLPENINVETNKGQGKKFGKKWVYQEQNATLNVRRHLLLNGAAFDNGSKR